MEKINQNLFKYNPVKFCVAKNKYCDQMNIVVDYRKYYIWLRHEMDGYGSYTNNYHVYSKVEFMDGMEFRPRKDSIGDLYYIKLDRKKAECILGKKAVDF